MIVLLATGLALAGTTWEDVSAARGPTLSTTTLAERAARTDAILDLVRSAPAGKVSEETINRAKAVGLAVVTKDKTIEVSEVSHGSEGFYAIRLGPSPGVASRRRIRSTRSPARSSRGSSTSAPAASRSSRPRRAR